MRLTVPFLAEDILRLLPTACCSILPEDYPYLPKTATAYIENHNIDGRLNQVYILVLYKKAVMLSYSETLSVVFSQAFATAASSARAS